MKESKKKVYHKYFLYTIAPNSPVLGEAAHSQIHM